MTRLLAELSKRRSFSLEVDQRVEEQYNIAPWHQVDGDDEDGGGGDDGRDGVDGNDGPEIEGALKPSTLSPVGACRKVISPSQSNSLGSPSQFHRLQCPWTCQPSVAWFGARPCGKGDLELLLSEVIIS